MFTKRIIVMAGMLMVSVFLGMQISYGYGPVAGAIGSGRCDHPLKYGHVAGAIDSWLIHFYSEKDQELDTIKFREKKEMKDFVEFCAEDHSYFSRCGEQECILEEGPYAGCKVALKLNEGYGVEWIRSQWRDSSSEDPETPLEYVKGEADEPGEISVSVSNKDPSGSDTETSSSSSSGGTNFLPFVFVLGVIYFLWRKFGEAINTPPEFICDRCRGKFEKVPHLSGGKENVWQCSKCGHKDVF